MENKKRIFTILSIDGGGVRGIISLRILQEIEERTGKPIASLFDMVSGASTGAIIGGSLVVADPKDPTKPRFSAKDVLDFYHRLSPKIFPEMRFKAIRKLSSGAIYDPKLLEAALQNNFSDAKIRDTLTSFLVPATDIKNFKPVWISSIKGQKDTSKEGWSSMLLRDAVRATTTAPSYFPAKYVETTPNEEMPNVKHRHALIDGSFFCGNTVQHLMTQAKKVAPPDAEFIIVHVGTGSVTHSLSPEEYNTLGPLGLLSQPNGPVLISLLVSMTSIDAENDMKEEYGDRFFSFNANIDPEKNPDAPATDMDDARPGNLKKLEKFAEKIIKDKSAEIDLLCEIFKGRELAEEKHLQSQAAMQQLAEKMEKTPTIKALMRVHLKVMRSNGHANAADKEIATLAAQLNDYHREEINRRYQAILHKRLRQGKIINTFKEMKEDITNITKKIFVDPFKDPPANDDKPSAPHMDKHHKGGHPGW